MKDNIFSFDGDILKLLQKRKCGKPSLLLLSVEKLGVLQLVAIQPKHPSTNTQLTSSMPIPPCLYYISVTVFVVFFVAQRQKRERENIKFLFFSSYSIYQRKNTATNCLTPCSFSFPQLPFLFLFINDQKTLSDSLSNEVFSSMLRKIYCEYYVKK